MCILFRIEGTIDLGDPSFERLIFLVVEGVEICETRVKLRFGLLEHSKWNCDFPKMDQYPEFYSNGNYPIRRTFSLDISLSGYSFAGHHPEI